MAGRMRSYKVLVVEDDPDIRSIALRTLEHPAIELLDARNGIEGLSLARKLKPHVAVLDVAMPGMDGLEMFRILRRELPKTKVIIMSAGAGSGALALAKDAGAFATLQKPFRARLLKETVLRALDVPATDDWQDDKRDRLIEKLREAMEAESDSDDADDAESHVETDADGPSLEQADTGSSTQVGSHVEQALREVEAGVQETGDPEAAAASARQIEKADATDMDGADTWEGLAGTTDGMR